jgi:hypothetical protein
MAAETTLWDRNNVIIIFRWTPLKPIKRAHSFKPIKSAGCVVSWVPMRVETSGLVCGIEGSFYHNELQGIHLIRQVNKKI